MKKLLFLISVLFYCLTTFVYSQAPQSFKYQAIARDIDGNVITNQQISLKINLLQGSKTGQIVYSEIHSLRTNQFGLISLEMGQGKNKTGEISMINWALGNYYVSTEVDITGGSEFVTMGVSQLLSVPYALYAENSGSGAKSDDDWITSGNLTYLSSNTALCGIGKSNPAYKLDINAATNDLYACNLFLTSNTANAATFYSQLSDTRTSGSDRGAGFYKTVVNPAGNSSASYYGLYGQSSTYSSEPDNINSIYGCRFTAQHSGTGNVFNLIGLNAYPYVNSSGGTVTHARGFYVYPWMGKGTITNWSGINIGDDNIGTGSMTNVYGIYMEEIDGGTSNNYAIYSKGGDVYFGGNVGIGTTAPAGPLDIMGAYHFPAADGTNGQVLKTDGSGTLSWGDEGGVTAINDLTDGKTGGNSVFLGSDAGLNDDGTNNRNVAVGIEAFKENITGDANSVLGRSALRSNTSGSGNVAVGCSALLLNTTGFENVALGSYAMETNTTGWNNIGIGFMALRNNTTADYNIAIGRRSSYNNTIGENNIAIGRLTNYYNETGSNNTIIGYEAGKGSSSHNKSGNVFLGYQAGYYATTDNKLYIENSNSTTPLIYGEFDNDLLSVNGSLGIGTTNPSEKLEVDGNIIADTVFAMAFSSTSPLKLQTNGITRIYVDDATGNVGIGTNAPGGKLDIAGSYHFPGVDGTLGQVLETNGSGHINWVDRGARDINELTDGKTGGQSLFLGSNAGLNDDGTTNNNVAVGFEALKANLNGDSNTGLGHGALTNNSSGSGNVAVGNNALAANTTGFENIALGSVTLENNTTGWNNIGIGFMALRNNTTADYNIAIGRRSSYSNTIGENNIAIGRLTNYYNETGSNNTIIGFEAGKGSSSHDKSGNVFLGYQAGYFDTTDNKLYIENSNSITPLIYGEFDTDKVTINDVLKLAPRASAPLSPSEGELYVNSSDHHIYCFLNKIWKQLD